MRVTDAAKLTASHSAVTYRREQSMQHLEYVTSRQAAEQSWEHRKVGFLQLHYLS